MGTTYSRVISRDSDGEWYNSQKSKFFEFLLVQITFVAKDVKINDFIALDNINVEGGSNEGCTRISK